MQFRTWGGARAGAGRKPTGERAGVTHARRPALDARHPVLVTLKVRRDAPNLRTQAPMGAIRRAFSAACGRLGVRLVHFSVQSNHLHLIVEAGGKRALSRGMQGLAIRVARRVNGAIGRAGSLFADRYHARALATPREVRHALAYVLLNRQRHGGGRRVGFVGARVDPCSSGAWFGGWRSPVPRGTSEAVTSEARTWLLARGWMLHGRIDPREVPGPGP